VRDGWQRLATGASDAGADGGAPSGGSEAVAPEASLPGRNCSPVGGLGPKDFYLITVVPASVLVGIGLGCHLQEQLDGSVPAPQRIRVPGSVPHDPPLCLAHDPLRERNTSGAEFCGATQQSKRTGIRLRLNFK
jgi:hypothetical protein